MVRIDVVELIVRAQTEAGGHGQQTLAPQRFEKGDVDAGQVADKTQIAFFVVVEHWFGPETLRVGGGNADGRLPFRGNRSGEALVQQARENHHSDVAGFAIRDAQTGDKFAFHAQALEGGSEQAAAAVDHQDFMALFGQRRDLPSQSDCTMASSSSKAPANLITVLIAVRCAPQRLACG